MNLEDRCCYCRAFSYFDMGGKSERTVDESYVCSTCVQRLDHKRCVTQQELMRFLNDPDEISRLEARVKDLEHIVASFAEMAA